MKVSIFKTHSKRTARTAERILKAVAVGTPLAHAARAAGIAYSTLCEWRNEDRGFHERLETAISMCVEKRLQTIQDAADAGDWRAAEAWLRVVLPTQFGRNRLEVTGPDGVPLSVGVRLYLPQKESATVDSEPVQRLALTEGNADANSE